jgi:hypothetical protein
MMISHVNTPAEILNIGGGEITYIAAYATTTPYHTLWYGGFSIQ